DAYDIRNLLLGSMKLDKGTTWSDDGTKLEMLGPASVTNLRATAHITRKKDGDRFQVEQVTIPDLHVDEIDASNVHLSMAAPPAELKAGTKAQPPKTVSLSSAKITDLKIEGFDLVKGLGTIETKSMEITDLGLQIGKKGEEAFKEGHLSVKGTGLTGRLTGPG